MEKSLNKTSKNNSKHNRREFLKAAAKRSAVLAGLIAGAHLHYKKPAVRSFFGVQSAYARQTNGATLLVTCLLGPSLGIGIGSNPGVEDANVCLSDPSCKQVTSAVGTLLCKNTDSSGKCTFFSAEGLSPGCKHEVSATKTFNSGTKPGSGIIPAKTQGSPSLYGGELVDIEPGENFVTIYLSPAP